MKIKLASVIVLILALSISVQSNIPSKIRIAVIDTGFNKTKLSSNITLCDEKSYDAVLDSEEVTFDASDSLHGTNILNIIAKDLKPETFCVYPIRVFGWNLGVLSTTSSYLTKAYRRLLAIKVDYVVLSQAGHMFLKEEQDLITKLESQNVVFFVAAGNYGEKLEKGNCRVYPACYIYKKSFVVGGLEVSTMLPHPGSNYGPVVNAWDLYTVENVSGTSMSAPNYLNKIVKRRQ